MLLRHLRLGWLATHSLSRKSGYATLFKQSRYFTKLNKFKHFHKLSWANSVSNDVRERLGTFSLKFNKELLRTHIRGFRRRKLFSYFYQHYLSRGRKGATTFLHFSAWAASHAKSSFMLHRRWSKERILILQSQVKVNIRARSALRLTNIPSYLNVKPLNNDLMRRYAANTIKAGNKQKHVTPRYQSTLLKRYTGGVRKLWLFPAVSKPSLVQWVGSKATKQDYEPKSINLARIPIFRTKPGYSTQWRLYRKRFQHVFFLPPMTQRAITKFISQLSKFKGVKGWQFMHSTLIATLLTALPLYHIHALPLFWFRTSCHLNRMPVKNLLCSVYPGDLITFSPSLLFSIFELTTGLFFSKQPKRKNYNWVNLFYSDIPSFLEVDFLTSSILILYDPWALCQQAHFKVQPYPYMTMKLYNWKYTV